MMKQLRDFSQFISHLFKSKRLILMLSYSDFKKQYLGSYLGIVWAVLRPLLFILVLWFVFDIGFKTKPIDGDYPFVLWLLCGMIPWFFFAEAVGKSMNSIVGNAFLVKKVAFRVSVLPLVSILSSLVVHLVLVGIMVLFFLFYGYMPTIYWLQLPYYVFCTMILVLGIGWLTSAVRVFVKDISEIIGVIIQFGFWLTPIFWSIERVPEAYRFILKINPMFYIVDGYRKTFIEQVWFWEAYKITPYFIVVTGVLFVGGAIVFKKLRPHFGDVA